MCPPPAKRSSFDASNGDPARSGGAEDGRPDIGGEYPDHVAIIMDGNGRWAQKIGLRRVFGHRRGVERVRDVTTRCAELNLKSLTLYAFSSENWKRPQREVAYLMRLLRRYLIDERGLLMDNNVRLRGLGRLDQLPPQVQATLRETEALTAGNDGLVLRLALSYGSRLELAEAARALALDVAQGRVNPDDIGEDTLRNYLYDPETPDPDLVIRTAGEMRLSNFLLWQASYSEFYSTPECWPEFEVKHLMEAFRNYAGRSRKYGGLKRETIAAEASRNRRRAPAS